MVSSILGWKQIWSKLTWYHFLCFTLFLEYVFFASKNFLLLNYRNISIYILFLNWPILRI